MWSYVNGNYVVNLYDNGTKVRKLSDDVQPIPERPESIDFKITNKCSMEHVCKWCHEASTIQGEQGDSLRILRTILSRGDYSGTEIAIGGGNPLEHESLTDFLGEARNRGLASNITVNERHLSPSSVVTLKQYSNEKLIHGIGISYSGVHIDRIGQLGKKVVLHLIAGINSISDLHVAHSLGLPVLILGYKTWGKGVDFYSPEVKENLWEWKVNLRKWMDKVHMSFDNLGIKQLKPDRFLSKQYWDKHYMGDDGTFTMYIDSVKKQFAPTSTSSIRWNIGNKTLKEMFQNVRVYTNM